MNRLVFNLCMCWLHLCYCGDDGFSIAVFFQVHSDPKENILYIVSIKIISSVFD